MQKLIVKRMKNSTTGNPNFQIMYSSDRNIIDLLVKENIIKEYKNKKVGTYLKTVQNIGFSYSISNNAVLEVAGVEFRVEIV
ncbi:MAG: hypothetical protein ACRCZ1_07465 [Cetobacterium sp.]